MDAQQEPAEYINSGAPDLTYEEIRLKARRPVHTTNSCKEEFQCGSQIALTAECDVYEPSEVYSSVDGPNVKRRRDTDEPAACSLRVSPKCAVFLAIIAVFAVSLALALSVLAVITTMAATDSQQIHCKGERADPIGWLKKNSCTDLFL